MAYFTRDIVDKGLLLNIELEVSTARANALVANQHPVPSPVVVQGIIDTGASCTALDPTVITSLGLSPTGKATILTPSTGDKPVLVDQYDVNLSIYSTVDEPPYHIQNLPVIESKLSAQQGFQMLIGRNVLERCLLVYNGTVGRYALAF